MGRAGGGVDLGLAVRSAAPLGQVQQVDGGGVWGDPVATIEAAAPGTTVALTIERADSPQTITLTLAPP